MPRMLGGSAYRYRDDGDAGLPNVRARYYDPQVGRFISRDPVLSEHPYLYCEHEPVNHVDPSGRLKIRPYVKWQIVKVKVEPDAITIDVSIGWRPLPSFPEIGIGLSHTFPVHPTPQRQRGYDPEEVFSGPPPGTKIRLPTSPPREVYV